MCSYGVGKRMKLAYTRKIIDAIHSGSLLDATYKKTDVFGLDIPTKVEGVPSEILDPVNTVSGLILSSPILHFIICFGHYYNIFNRFFECSGQTRRPTRKHF